MTIGYGLGLGLMGISITIIGCYVLLFIYNKNKEDK